MKEIGLAFQIWAGDNDNHFPMELLTNATSQKLGADNLIQCLKGMSNELNNTRVLTCPGDDRSPAADFNGLKVENVSYFLSMDARVGSLDIVMSGDRNLTMSGKPVIPGLMMLPTNSVVGWTRGIHNHNGNMLLSGGAVVQGANALYWVKYQNTPSNHIVIP